MSENRNGKAVSYEDAFNEVVADAMSTMFSDGNLYEKLAELKAKDKGLFNKIKQFIDNVISKFREVYAKLSPDQKDARDVRQMKDTFDRIQTAFAEALVEASENFREAKENATADSRTLFSLRGTNKDGIEVYETSEEIKKLPYKERRQRFLEIMKNEYRGRTAKFIRNGHVYYATFEESDVNKNIYGDKLSDPKGWKAKINVGADGNIFELVENAKYNGSLLEQGKKIDAHKGVGYWDYFIKTVQIDDKTFDLVANVRKKSDGAYVYSIQLNQNKTIEASPPLGSLLRALSGVTNASMDSVAQKSADVNTKFSLRDPVEYTKDLVALHNLTEDKLEKSLKLGGFPMPSIAVTRSDIPHTNFGDITLVFGKETIDPKASRKNTVYSADAWTPTFPQIEYEADSKATSRVYKQLSGLGKQVDEYFRRDLGDVTYNIGNVLNQYGGEEGVVQAALDNYGLKAAYLEEQGKHIAPETKQETVGVALSDEIQDRYVKIMDILDVDAPEQIGELSLKEVREQHGAELEAVYPGITQSDSRLGRMLNRMKAWLQGDNGTEVKTVIDEAATRNAVDSAIDKTEYEAWVRNLYRGVEKSSGIYNGKERYTASGNLKSFKQTHLPATLDGIVKAMAAQNNGNTKNVSGFNGVKSLRAGTAERFASIADMHEREGRLQHLTQEQADRISDALQNRTYELIERIDKANSQKGDSNSLIRFDTIGNILMEISEGDSYNVSDIQRVFAEYSRAIGDDLAIEIKQLLFDISQMPVNIFEAKPERAVAFSEIKAAVLPDGTSQAVVNGLQQNGVPVMFYEKGNNDQRLELVNSLDGVKFSERDGQYSYDYSKSFSQQVEDYKNGKIPSGDSLIVGATPEVFQKIGFNALPVTINQKHIDYALNGTKDFDHHLGETLLEQLPEAIKNPVAIMTSATKASNSVVAMLEIRQNGKQVIVPVAVDGFGRQNGLRIDSNAVTSIYGKKYSISKVLHDAIEQEANGQFRLYYLNENKATALLQGTKDPMPKMPATQNDGYIHRITEANSHVKSKITNVTESQQFKRWFGDWQNNPANASKVVNADGTPKIVYHGTTADFAAFEPSTGALGKGIYFSDSKDFAKGYTYRDGQSVGDVIEAYIDMKNPYYVKYADNYDVEKLKSNGYDGIIHDRNGMYMVFSPEQVKSATDNIGTFDKNNPDMRYSERDRNYDKVAKQLEAQNEKLREDVTYLKKMLKLQKSLTHGKEITKSSVEAAARVLKKYADASGNTKELSGHLDELYRYIASGDELTWEGVVEKAQPAVDWLMENKVTRLDTYAQTVLDDIKGGKFYLDETQKQEVISRYGSMAEFRKALGGTVTVSDNANMSINSWWQEMTSMYPGNFDNSISAADMPLVLADIIGDLKGMTSAEDAQWAYNRKYVEQDLLRQVYDSYWNVSTLRTVADVKQKQIDKLKAQHADRMRKVKEANRETIQKIRNEHQEKMKTAAQKRATGKEQRELRYKIRKKVRDLNKVLNRGNKQRNVKEDMKGFVSKSLELADYLFTDHISNDELIRRGITVRMTEKEAQLVKETEGILSKLYDNADSLTDEEFTRLDAKRKANEAKLKGLLQEQRNEVQATPVYRLFDDLVNEYASLKDSNQEAVRAAYNGDVEQLLRSFMGGEDSERAQALQNMRIADMTTAELQKLYDAYTVVLTTVRDANKFHINSIAQSVELAVSQIAGDFAGRKIPETKADIAKQKIMNKIGWDYEKPYYALDRIGSDTFTKLMNNLADSENTVMRDVIEAVAFRNEIIEKYGYNNWEVNRELDRDFLDKNGKKFRLTLAQIMSLYAYSRRESAWNHIEYGGFVFGDTALTNPNPADSYKLTKAQCEEITSLLTEEQKAYAEEMQKFLSDVMGAKGNEVSMQLYGITMFGEKNYFPLHIAGQFKARAQEAQAKQASGFGSLSNAGFTKAQNQNAKAPFVLEGFNDVWADHVNEMSRYHGTVPALEDIRRVMNWSVYSDSMSDSQSLRQIMENHYGKEAVAYFDNLYREANSGAVMDKLQRKSKKLLSLFRKNSVAYSLSVSIQQPTSIVRAYAMIDKKYFGYKGYGSITAGIGKAVTDRWKKEHTNAYNEMLKYAPGVTMAKEIGGFDTATGNSIRSYLMDTEKTFGQKWNTGTGTERVKAVMDLVDDNAVANIPNLADKITWIEIWNACKRETVAKYKELTPGSDAFMQKVGERFTEVIRATQVYDSMFARSPMLKSKNLAIQYLVSFMDEPNTTANMVEKGIRDIAQGNKESGIRTLVVIAHSIIFTNLVKSLIYAMRDDDEDETYIEKYIEALTGGLLDDFNPFNYIPIARDVWSLAQGYDVERSDMEIAADLLDAVEKVIKYSNTDTDDMTQAQLAKLNERQTEASWRLVESLAAFLGIPIKNVRREVNAILDHAAIAYANFGKTTWRSAWDKVKEAFLDSVPFTTTKTSKTDRIYTAIVEGDETYLQRLKDSYTDSDGNFNQSSYDRAVRTALKENEPRIKEAAQARVDGDIAKCQRIYHEIKNDIGGNGQFTADQIMDAIYSMESDIKNGLATEKAESRYDTGKFVEAVNNGKTDTAIAMREDIINTHMANGKTQSEAEAAFASSLKKSVEDAFCIGELDATGAENLLTGYAGMDREDAAYKVDYWAFCDDNPEYAESITEAKYKKYMEYAEPEGISPDVYAQFIEKTKGIEAVKDKDGNVEVSKRDQILEVINAMDLTWQQKDALYLAAGLPESKKWEVPW